MPVKEREFRRKLKRELKDIFPGCIILPGDSSETQGFPDLIILYNNKWAALETKKASNSSKRPNQDYWVDVMNKMSFAAFVCPENKEEILNGLQQTLTTRRSARLPKC